MIVAEVRVAGPDGPITLTCEVERVADVVANYIEAEDWPARVVADMAGQRGVIRPGWAITVFLVRMSKEAFEAIPEWQGP